MKSIKINKNYIYNTPPITRYQYLIYFYLITIFNEMLFIFKGILYKRGRETSLCVWVNVLLLEFLNF